MEDIPADALRKMSRRRKESVVSEESGAQIAVKLRFALPDARFTGKYRKSLLRVLSEERFEKILSHVNDVIMAPVQDAYRRRERASASIVPFAFKRADKDAARALVNVVPVLLAYLEQADPSGQVQWLLDLDPRRAADTAAVVAGGSASSSATSSASCSRAASPPRCEGSAESLRTPRMTDRSHQNRSTSPPCTQRKELSPTVIITQLDSSSLESPRPSSRRSGSPSVVALETLKENSGSVQLSAPTRGASSPARGGEDRHPSPCVSDRTLCTNEKSSASKPCTCKPLVEARMDQSGHDSRALLHCGVGDESEDRESHADDEKKEHQYRRTRRSLTMAMAVPARLLIRRSSVR